MQPRLRRPPAAVDEAVDVAVVLVAAPVEVGLEAVGGVHEEVLVRAVVGGAVVGVDGLLRGGGAEEEVNTSLSPNPIPNPHPHPNPNPNPMAWSSPSGHCCSSSSSLPVVVTARCV